MPWRTHSTVILKPSLAAWWATTLTSALLTVVPAVCGNEWYWTSLGGSLKIIFLLCCQSRQPGSAQPCQWSAKMVNLNPLPNSQLLRIVQLEIWQEWLRHAVHQACQVLLGSYKRWCSHVVVQYRCRVSLKFFFFFLAKNTAHTLYQFPRTIAQKTRFDVRICPLSVVSGIWLPGVTLTHFPRGKAWPEWKSQITYEPLKVGKICQWSIL